MKNLSAAEEFFAYFDVAFDLRVLGRARLHILKKFHDNLAGVAGLDDLDDAAQRAIYQEQLRRAYRDFTGGPALAQRVFPKLSRLSGAFVPLSSVQTPSGHGS